MKYLTRLSLGIATLLLAACATAPTTPTSTSQKPKEGKADEAYVYQSSLASRIPRKVKKSQAATAEETTEQSQQALREVQMNGAPTPGGN